MKKSLLTKIIPLSVALLVLPVQANAESVDYREGTKIELIGKAENQYTVTVPANMTPGETDKVLIEGTWDADCFVTVTVPATATVTYRSTSLEIPVTLHETVDDKTGFSLLGNKFEPISREFNLTIGDKSVLFGEWTGSLCYDVTLVVKGDVDQNGFVDADDIAALTDHINGTNPLTTAGQLVADIDGDASLTSNDATLLNSMITNNTPNRNIPSFVPESIINFKISDISYQADRDMTWAEWIASDYNTAQFVLYPDGKYMGYPDIYVYIRNDGSLGPRIESTDIIIENTNYFLNGGSN